MTEQTNSQDLADLAWIVGDRFRKAREIKTKMDRKAFAAAVGCSRDLVQKIEESDELPKPYMIMAWAAVCDVSIDYLKTGAPSGYPPPKGGIAKKSPRSDSNRRHTAYNSTASRRSRQLVAA